MISPADRFACNCAQASLNQIGGFAETASPSSRRTTQGPVMTRLGPLPKLPLQDCAGTTAATLQPVSAGTAGSDPSRLKITFQNNVLGHVSSLGGETTPYGGGGERRRRVLPLPPPGGFARVACPRPRIPIRRQRPDLPGHMPAVVAHPQNQPEKETTMAELTLTTRMREATPDMPPAFRADRTMLALDLGTTTGWALHGQDGLITSGTVSFRPGRFDGGGMRYLRFTNWLGEIDRLSGPISTIWFEEVRRHAGTDAAHVYGGLMATLTAWAELRGVPYEGVPVGTIKRHATGKGNADKEAMIAAARARGFSPADDNEADAIAILFWALETGGGVA